MTSSFTLAEIADRLGARLIGDPALPITGVGSLESARPEQISHLSNPAYRRFLDGCRAGAVLLREADLEAWPGAALVVPDPYLAFARVSQLFAAESCLAEGVDASAALGAGALIDPSARIGPGVVVGARTRIGADVVVHAHAVIGADCVIGAGTRIFANAVLYDGVTLGSRCLVHSGAVIGADGFGFAPDERGALVAIAQLGGVRVGNDVSIGACTTIDRGAIEDTVIEDGVKIDNQVQIGHNCHVGAHSVICGCVGIVGSTRIGRHCVLAGGVGIGGSAPITICDGVRVSGMTHVSASISEPGTYSGGVLHEPTRRWKKNALRLKRLNELFRRVAELEKRPTARR